MYGLSKHHGSVPWLWKDTHSGVPPRGFYFQTAPVRLLVVGKNPGHPLSGESAQLARREGMDLLKAYRRFQARYYPEPGSIPEPSNRFHKNLFRYLSYFLDVPQNEIYRHAAHTNLVKCSTPNERAILPMSTMEQCFGKYFLRELNLLQPRVLIALGREVDRFLLAKASVHKLEVVYVKHPAYPYARSSEAAVLRSIRERIRRCL